jgi:hypothetical protein
MESLDNYIRQHRPDFNSEEPADGHFSRFETRLHNRQLASRRRLAYYIAAAASVVVLFSFTALLVYQKFPVYRIARQTMNVNRVNEELGETEQFYSSLISNKTDILNQMKFPSESQKEAVLREFKEKDEIFVSLQNDLREDPNNEIIISALINYYQVKLNILNQLIQNLDQVLNNNQGSHGHEETII